MRGWEKDLPAAFPLERLRRDALREAERRRSDRQRRYRVAATGLCTMLLIAGAVVLADRESPQQVRSGPASEGGEFRRNGKIAFIRSAGPEDPSPRIYVMNEDGSGQTMIAETTRADRLTWSPDGTKLAFADVGGIYTVNADGSGEMRVPTTTASDQWPAWSPDGTKFAIRRAEGRTDGIDVVNVDGSGRRRLIAGNSAWPAWSPDGRSIAYSSVGELYLVGADGHGRKKLTDGGFDDAPTWSPDGRSIAYRHNDSISVIAVDSGDTRALASPGGTALADPNGRGANKLAAGRGSPATPQWSPDGRKIVYALYQSGEACSIWIMNADGSGQAPLTDNRTCDRDPAWQPIP